MPFPFKLFQVFAKVIAIRLKRHKNQGWTQHNSITANHEGHSSVMCPWGASSACEASDIAQVTLSLVQPLTRLLVGTPMNVAIGGLLGILQLIIRCDQNKAALDDLGSRLHQLCCYLWSYRRDLSARKLQDTSAHLEKFQKWHLAYASVTQAITACSTDIDHYLTQYLVVFYSLVIACIHSLLYVLRRLEERPQSTEQAFATPSASIIPGSVAPGCVTLVDAAGRQQTISVNWCTSYQRLNHMLRFLFERDAIEAQNPKTLYRERKH
ncbi:uncharacterized protein EDB93DRAFT_212777 [Suillus bovinus]|uniref:uncharacterized protein n=1 Tax=Suillus bovinus TaxID=48563 RepID=UPI001B86BC3F|nr:uncharacterized protein EDB93DRAFT_212777 [Suillus bovinus]KAG2153744.1 hypothetical protein EDB93DRAFT_212777 [Suillus bovinus]